MGGFYSCDDIPMERISRELRAKNSFIGEIRLWEFAATTSWGGTYGPEGILYQRSDVTKSNRGGAARLDPDEVGLRLVQTSIGPRPMRTVTFPGLCTVLIRSDTHQSTTRHRWIKTRACPALWWRELTSPPR